MKLIPTDFIKLSCYWDHTLMVSFYGHGFARTYMLTPRQMMRLLLACMTHGHLYCHTRQQDYIDFTFVP